MPSLTRRAAIVGARPADAVLPAIFGVVGSVEMLAQHYDPLVVSIGTYLAACAATVVRRGHPLMSAGGVLASFAAAPALGFDVSQPASWILTLVLASFAVGRHLPRNAIVKGFLAITVLLGGAAATLALMTGFSPDAIFGVAATYAPWALGIVVRNAEDLAAWTALENERTRVEDAVAAERSASHERDRIAREIHDVLAHSLSLMVVQAAVAENVIGHDPDGAIRAVQEVQTSGRLALGEVGRLVRLIRDDSILDPVAQVDLLRGDLTGSIKALAEDVGRAGLPVSLEIADAQAVSPSLHLTVYRIAQEALTNALRHASGAQAHIRLTKVAEAVEIVVSNTPGVESDADGDGGGGHGLAGLQERVALFSGTISYGPDPSGGFTVRATLPCDGSLA
jgi:signal transduction histidine kinase